MNTRARTEEADAVAAAIRAGGGSAFAVTANVTDPSAVRRMFETVADQGTLRVLVNNASYRFQRQRVQAITEDDWRCGPLGHPRRRLSLSPVAAACAHPGWADRQHPRPQRTGRRPRTGAPLGGQARAAGPHAGTRGGAARRRGGGQRGVATGMEADVTVDLELRCRAEIASAVARLAFVDAKELTRYVVRVDCDGSVVSAPTA